MNDVLFDKEGRVAVVITVVCGGSNSSSNLFPIVVSGICSYK